MALDVKFKGLKALQAALDTLPVKVEQTILRSSLRAGAKHLQTIAKSSAAFNDQSGQLRASIRVSTSKQGSKLTASVIAGASKSNKAPWYGVIVERGAKPHEIKAPPHSALQLPGGKQLARVQHPGSAPHPFMVPAFDQGGQGAVKAVAEHMRKRLAKKYGLEVPKSDSDGLAD
ncbi:HK97-gp10 family putative phage morphogenesis protein [Aquabacterium sp.]|uniref:HK97-gp10 family putative phage morphogenesis protein n=1 Tax=Aquabacterium sp. TaxID=1872578 RepID=UPI00378420C5